MTPLPEVSRVVVLVNENKEPVSIASNIAPAPKLEVKLVTNPADFEEARKGLPYTESLIGK